MPKASDIVVDRNLSILLKGPWGFGKTLAAASFAIDGPVFIAYWDKKKPIELNWFRQFGQRGQRILNNIEYEVYGAENANEFLNKLISFSKNCNLFAFVNDSVTNMTSGAVNWSLSFRDDRKDKNKLKLIPDFDEYKVETSLVTQSLDICRTLPCNIIWTCHPVPSIKIEGTGANMKITKTNPIVTYGSKVAGIVPGNFSEIYHFTKQSAWDSVAGKNSTKYLISTDQIGDDFAKSNIGLKGEIDITDKFFYDVWKERIAQNQKEMNDAIAKSNESNVNLTYANTSAPVVNQVVNQPTVNQKKWNSEKGIYE